MSKERYRLGSWKGTNIVIDSGWGDGGKGKLVDVMAKRADYIIRFNGGPNAGHTVKNEYGEFRFHSIPSGIFNPDAICVIAGTVAVNPTILVEEIDQLRQRGIEVSASDLLISQDAHLIMPWHIMRDKLKEKARGERKIGTTGQGIGPLFADRTERSGLKVKDLLNKNFERLFDREFAWQEKLIAAMAGPEKDNYSIDRDTIFARLRQARGVIEPMITNTFPVITKAHFDGKNLLGEGAQGALLDLDLGGYPYVTATHPTLAGFSQATGIYEGIKRVIGVTKAYQTRVGEGPMPTELLDESGEALREKGKEYGATTGRARRCGWLDIPAVRYGCFIGGVRSIALTKLDVLDSFEQIKVCVAYEVDGHTYHMADPTLMEKAKPVFLNFKGWNKPIGEIRAFRDLPFRARVYTQAIENFLKLPIEFVSNGPSREQSLFP
jgi:adenylosuccinate synthase